MTERTTSAEDTQNQHYQCVHTVVDSRFERELLKRELCRNVLGDSDVWNSLRSGTLKWCGDG